MTYTIWDGTAPIDGRTREYILARHPEWGKETVYIIRRADGTLADIIALSAIPNPNNLTDADAIVAAYIEALSAPQTPSDAPTPTTDTEARLAALEAELSGLSAAIERGLAL